MNLAIEPKANKLLIWFSVLQGNPIALSLTKSTGVGFLLVFLQYIIWFCWGVPHCPSSPLLSHTSLLCGIWQAHC